MPNLSWGWVAAVSFYQSVCVCCSSGFFFPLFFPLGGGTDGRNSPGEDEFRSEREGESRAWPPKCRPPQTSPSPATNISPSCPSVSSRHIRRRRRRRRHVTRPGADEETYLETCPPAVFGFQKFTRICIFFKFPPLNYLGLSFWSSSLTKLAALQNSWKSDLRGCFIFLMLLLLSWPKK